MLSLEIHPPPPSFCNSSSLLPTSTSGISSETRRTTFSFQWRRKGTVPHNSIFASSLLFCNSLNFRGTYIHGPLDTFGASGNRLRATNGKRSRGGNSVHLEKGFDDSDGYDNDEDEDEDEDEEDEMFLPLAEMKKWLENKPPGFGIGKVYDTTIEDTLLEEMSQSQLAQAANINKLKNSPDKPSSKKEQLTTQKANGTWSGVRVRVVNLPKKKNVHRDLKIAFSGAPGLIKIVPAVSGNSKTRDPICKGFAFVEFKTEKDAIRFVQTFSRQSTNFGRVQKEIRCEMINTEEESVVNDIHAAAQAAAATVDLEAESGSSEEDISDEKEENEADGGERVEAEFEEIRNDLESSFSLSDFDNGDDDDGMAVEKENGVKYAEAPSVEKLSKKKEAAADTKTRDNAPRVNKGKLPSANKPKGVKEEKKKVPKLVVPGSAKRLQIKEKAVLSGVFSKYGANVAKET